MNTYTQGTLVNLTGNFTAVAGGAFVDPTTVTCRVRLPNGTISDISASVTKTAVGQYAAQYLPTMTGQYAYEFIGTGAVEAASVSSFYVSPATF